jgi:hypothetical protein
VVEEGVWRIGLGEIDDTARQLLREMGYQAEGSPPEDDVVPREAAQNLGLDPGAPEYVTRQGQARVRELHRR